jgi:glucosamine--fructose-6-phosphate aminotransferase (isomerizing)
MNGEARHHSTRGSFSALSRHDGSMTEFEQAIRSQAVELERLAARDYGSFAVQLEGRQRVWLVGTGSSQHVAELGALLLAEAGLDARWSGSSEFARHPEGPRSDDAVIVISHTARTSFAIAAREAALRSGAEVLSITGIGGGWPEAIEAVGIEQSETYTVSVTAALMVLFRLAHELGTPGLSWSAVLAAVERVRSVVETTDVPAIQPPHRALVLVGAGAGAVSAREGALKLREAARVLAEGYGSEYLLHGSAVPLGRRDALLLVGSATDPDGLLPALGDAAHAEGLEVASIDEPAIEHPILAQLPIIVQLQLLALRFSQARATDPDKAIVGNWADKAIWAIGSQ